VNEVTRILSAIELGDPSAANELLPLIDDELRQLAAARLAQEKPGQTLQATALVHEAYLRLVDTEQVQRFNSRGHFFAAAAETMRRILVEAARRKRRPKHGGDRQRIDLEEALCVANPREDVVDLDDALTRLAAQQPVKAELVKMRYFAGLSLEEVAALLGISQATAKRYWAVARAWLFADLAEPGLSLRLTLAGTPRPPRIPTSTARGRLADAHCTAAGSGSPARHRLALLAATAVEPNRNRMLLVAIPPATEPQRGGRG
jgi:RNA polymerase sigma factor (TIGR02999 family)